MASDGFSGIPSFPDGLKEAPINRISLKGILEGNKEDVEKVWEATVGYGFFVRFPALAVSPEIRQED